MKKRALALCLAILAFLPAGCAPKPAERSENTLTLLVKDGDVRSYIQRAADLYEEQTGIRIEFIRIGDVDFEEEATAMFERGDIPDMLLHFNDANLVHFNVEENFLYLNDQPWVDELTAGARACCLDGEGNLLGLPFWESSVSGCYYNKTLLNELGLKPAATQAEFDALCAALKAAGHTPLYWPANGCHWMFQFGLDPIFADDPALLEKLNQNEIAYADIPAVLDMITWLDNANRRGWFNADYENRGWDDISPAMAEGKAAAIFLWDTWFSTDFADGGTYTGEDFALMPVFMGTAGMGTYEGGNMCMLMVNKNGERLKQVLEFLSFCAAPENYNIAFEGIFTVNCFKNQTTNIQSQMVTDNMASVEARQRASTAWPRIIGYRQEDVGAAVLKLFRGEVDAAGCVALMDECRIAAAREFGADGF